MAKVIFYLENHNININININSNIINYSYGRIKRI